MNTKMAVLQGVVKPDGELTIEGKTFLPAGPVQVTVVPLPDLPKNDPFWQRMQAIWAGQMARDHSPRSAEDLAAEKRASRDEWDERMQRIEQIQAEAKAARDSGAPTP